MKKNYFMIALMFTAVISKAQMIPNSGFENWTTMTGYSNPDGWGNMNNTSAPISVFTCEQGTPGASGASFLKLTSKTSIGGVIPGVAVSGVIDSVTQTAKSGFAYTNRSVTFGGKWQHMISGTSQGFIDVKLTRWDSGMNMRVTLANAHQVLSGMAMSWANFSIPLVYGTDTNNPDTCIITLSASGATPADGDYLWVDALGFSGTMGIDENGFGANVSVFPNPTSDNLIVDLSSIKEQKVTVTILDMQGKLVKSIGSVVATSSNCFDIADMAKGNYLLNVVAKEGTVNRKFIKK